MKKIIGVLGPTAGGKTALAIGMAKHYNTEIISCDSMQIYDRLLIGTARPTGEEMCGIKHHLMGFLDPRTSFSCADYVAAAADVVRDMTVRGKLPIFCGGTGLYFDSFLRGEDALCATAGDPAVRERLNARCEAQGIDGIYEELTAVDPVSAAQIHKNNTRRVIRALEIYMTTGKPKSEWDEVSKQNSGSYAPLRLILDFHDRSVLHGRIEKRVDAMLSRGLYDEVRSLLAEGFLLRDSTAAQAIGYKEMISAIAAGGSMEAAREAIIIATRQYAKRQLTWFRREPDAVTLYVDDYDTPDGLLLAALGHTENFLKTGE